MNNLKGKLAQKIDVIDTEEINNSGNDNFDEYDFQDNLITLKTNKDNNPHVSIVPEFAITLDEAKQRIIMLQNFIKEIMLPNIDYGRIPKCNKLTLFKSGAEKLCDIYGFGKKIEITNRIEDWSKGLFHYEVKAILINKKTGLVEAEGIGCCNNKERKFINQDSFSIINTIIKMAKKRAFIDAVLSATRCSGIFNQDAEDIEDFSQTNMQGNIMPNNFYNGKNNRRIQSLRI